MAINESKIASVVNALMEDYGKGRVIDEIKMFDYPDRAVIIDLLEKLKIIIYPGYHRNGNYRTYTVKNNISILLEDIIYNLTKQIAVVLKYAPQPKRKRRESPLHFSTKSRKSGSTSKPTFRRSMTETPPPITRTRSFAPIRACTRFLLRGSPTSCFCSACR